MDCDILIVNIRGLMQVREHHASFLSGSAMALLPSISNAYLAIAGGRIADFGPMGDLPRFNAREEIDARDRYIFPSFVDSHTHLVFAASREDEFVMKIRGATYEEIAARGGGILNSAKKLQQTSDDELLEGTLKRASEIIATGTGAVEIKSGYGLTVKDELRMLRIGRKVAEHTSLAVKTSFLGAHAVPSGMKKEDYINLIINEMLPAVASERLADYTDVFCEQGFFTPEETERIVEEGKRYGLKPRIHANQLHRSGGVQVGVKTGAISVDHLENAGEDEIKVLKNSKTMPTALPGAAFFLGLPFPPARRMIDAGLPLAIASDFNPGSAPSGNMQLIVALACIKMRMTPEEAFNAATVNTAYAMDLSETHGSITKGKAANIFITKHIPSVAFIPYAFGSQLVERVILKGRLIPDS